MPILIPIHSDSTAAAGESSITIFVDILDAAIVAVQSAPIRRYSSRLLVDGDPVPIRSATIEARKDSLGTELRVMLAIADKSQVTFGSAITFQIGLWVTGAWTWLPLLEGGRLSSIDNPIRNNQNAPADEVSISIVDVIADRWNRAPRAPIHLYDSNQLSAPDQSARASQRIELQTGGVIVPVNTPIAGMTLQHVLDAAYVDGTGFDSVVTNIPDFPVAEADFTLDGGFDAGVRPLLTLFAPLLFERNNVLFIIDPDGPLPAGFSPRAFPQSLTRELTDSTPQREPVNAILLRLRGASADSVTGEGVYYTEVSVSDPPVTSGTEGTKDYTTTTVEKLERSYRNLSDPSTVLRREVVEETTTVTDWEDNIIERTVLRNSFDFLNRNIGYQRTIAKRLPDPAAGGAMTLFENAAVQIQSVTYRPSPMQSRDDVQDTVTTVESGLILVDPDTQYLGADYRIPLIDGHVSGYVTGSTQFVEAGPIKTTMEQLRNYGELVEVETRVINHLSNTTQTSLTSRPGSAAINRARQGNTGSGAARTLLITVPGTDALGRRAQTFDAGMLPEAIAIDLGERKLRRMNDPPRQLALSPAYVDVSIKRGTLLAIEARGETVGTYIVEGYSISFQTDAVTMNVTARELKD